MTERAAERARACFRLAADQGTTQGERDAALARGMAILQRNGLDPDRFDIPGRERPVQPGGERFGRWAHKWTTDPPWGMPVFTMDDLVRGAVDETLRRRREQAAASAAGPQDFPQPCPACGTAVTGGGLCVACKR